MEPDINAPELPEYEEKGFWPKLKADLVDLFEFIAIIGAVLVIIRFFVAEPHKVSGSSMVPNFYDGDYIITNKVSARFTEPTRGEVIILQNPRDPKQDFIKRIVALPGDHIKILNGEVYVNNQLQKEDYLPRGVKTFGGEYLSEGQELIVQDGYYFVMGDNRPGSSDSRAWGPVKKSLIVGQAWLRYWPPQAFTLIKVSEASSRP